MLYQLRKRTELEDIVYSLHLYFSGLSLRNTSKALSRFVQRSHTAIRDWIQKYKPERLFYKKVMVSKFIIDETQLKVGSEYIWLWVAIEPKDKEILSISISKERNMFVAERFLSNLIKDYDKHPVSTDGGTWYPQACQFLKLNHHIHTSFENNAVHQG
jgi:putative transposase